MFSMGLFGGLAMAAITLAVPDSEPRPDPNPEPAPEPMICAVAPPVSEGRDGAEALRTPLAPDDPCTLTVVLHRQTPTHTGCERTALRAAPLSWDRIWLRLRVESDDGDVLEVLELSRDGGHTWKPHSITRRSGNGFESGWL